MSLRKKIEHGIRHFRSYILPSHRRSAINTRKAASPIPLDKPLCVIDFKSIKIDNVTGRYLYHLVTEFEALGYAIAYTDRFRFHATMEIKACKQLLLSHEFSIVPLNGIPSSCELLLTDTPESHSNLTAKIINVVYDQLRAPSDVHNAFELPFFVHPDIHESGQVERFIENTDLSQPRPISIIFAGNAKEPKYDATVLPDKYNVLTRVKALAIAEKSLGPDLIRRPLSLNQLIPLEENHSTLTIATTQDLRIPSEQWIQTLALGDFYFACPGVEMPLCHNLIESLAAGSIPILQYPQYLTPALEDGVNCLVFHDENSLIETLEKALKMPSEDIREIQNSAHSYYKKHLQPGCFARQLINSKVNNPVIYLNAYRVPR